MESQGEWAHVKVGFEAFVEKMQRSEPWRTHVPDELTVWRL